MTGVLQPPRPLCRKVVGWNRIKKGFMLRTNANSQLEKTNFVPILLIYYDFIVSKELWKVKKNIFNCQISL
jgi:hypothetical protein